MKAICLLCTAALLAAASFPALAQTAPAQHLPGAVKVAVGVNGVWLDGPVTDFAKDAEAGAVVSASLTPHVSAVGHGFYGFDGKYVRYDGEARVTATDVNDPNFNVYLGLRYRSGSTNAVRPSEWAPDAGVGWKPNPAWKHVIIGADAGYGLTTKNLISYAALRWQF